MPNINSIYQLKYILGVLLRQNSEQGANDLQQMIFQWKGIPLKPFWKVKEHVGTVWISNSNIRLFCC